MIQDSLSHLTGWLKACCEDGEMPTIKLGTIDNPGWYLTVDLEKTNLANKKMDEVAHDFSGYDWLICWVRDKKFEAHGGVSNLETMLRIFKLWALDLDYTRPSVVPKSQFDTEDDFLWLINWFYSQCNNDWEHGYGIEITTTENLTWIVRIELTDTVLSEKKFMEVSKIKSSNDWIKCCVKNGKFEGAGGLDNLYEIFNVFRTWAKNYKLSDVI
ncbi:MAG: Imm53 family immunity protein [Chlamydiales bacterium]|nr:Imm53 family immunity protein [Chlamydiales bacterium]